MSQVATRSGNITRDRNAAGVRVSIVIPAHNALATLPEVLTALTELPADWELILVDDHSTDDTPIFAARKGARVFVSEGRHRDSAARNTGARNASGEVLAFLDSDVVAGIDTISRAVDAVRRGECACVFGVYDRGDHLPDLVSRFKNFWIRVSTLTAPRPLDWINTSLAVMRYSTWETVGGFEEAFTLRHGGGDLDFGRRVLAEVGPIVADTRYEVTHLKRFHLGKLLHNDFERARGWLSLAWRRRGVGGVLRKPQLANVGVRFSLGVLAAAGSVAATAAAGIAWGLHLTVTPVFLGIAAVCLVSHAAAAGSFLQRARAERIRGHPWFLPLLWIDQIACATGLASEVLQRALRRPHPVRERSPLATESRLPGGVAER